MLDDLLVGDGGLVGYGRESPTHALMGRFGNVLLVNGEPRWDDACGAGRSRAALPHQRREHARVQLSFDRPGRAGPSGVRMKVVASDLGRYEREAWVDERDHRARRALRRRRALRASPGTCAGQPRARASTTSGTVLRRDHRARHRDRVQVAGRRRTYRASVRASFAGTPRWRPRSIRYRRAHVRTARQTTSCVITLEAGDLPFPLRPLLQLRIGLPQPGGVERDDARDGLGRHRPARAVAAARRTHRAREHGHRLALPRRATS